MGMMTFSVAEDVAKYIEERVDEEFPDSAAVVAELVRHDRERRLAELRQHIDESLASGVSDRTTDEIFAEAVKIAKVRGTYRD